MSYYPYYFDVTLTWLDYLLTGFAYFIVFLYIAYIIAYFLVAQIYAPWCLRSSRIKPYDVEFEYPGVSILKPLCGADGNLYYNLASFFELNYPIDKYEILICVENPRDPAYKVAESVIAAHPKVNAHICCGGPNVTYNGKVANLARGYRRAKFDYLYIADANLHAHKDQVLDMVNQLELPRNPDVPVGLVAQTPYFGLVPNKEFIWVVNKMYFGCEHAKFWFGGSVLNFVTTGQSVMLRRDVIEHGTLEEIGMYIAEDHQWAVNCSRMGYRMRMGQLRAIQNPYRNSFSAFQSRMTRWATVRTRQVPLLMVFEFMGMHFINGMWVAYLYNYALGVDMGTFYVAHLLLMFLLDYAMLRAINIEPIEFSRSTFLAGWLTWQFNYLIVFVRGSCSNTVKWQNNAFRVHWFGRITPLPPKELSIQA